MYGRCNHQLLETKLMYCLMYKYQNLQNSPRRAVIFTITNLFSTTIIYIHIRIYPLPCIDKTLKTHVILKNKF